MSDKKTEKSPYRSYTIDEVMQVETGSYYLQIGESLFESETGKVAFSKDRAEHFYMSVWEGLKDMKANGTVEEKKEADFCLLHFRIIPLRFH